MESTYFQPATLGEFNEALVSLALQPAGQDRFAQILETEPKPRLVEALNRARNDEGAMAYLRGLFGDNAAAYQGNNEEPQQQGTTQSYDPPAPASSAPQSNQQEQTAGNGEEKRGSWLKKHVYGGKAALCFEEDETRAGMHTICLDAADATAPLQYNWKEKLRVQLTRDELLVVTAVLFGMLPRCEYKNHGQDKSKGFFIEDQGDKLFVKVFSSGAKMKAVPVTPEDAFFVAQICLGQMKKNAPWLEASEIMATLQRVVAARKMPQAVNH